MVEVRRVVFGLLVLVCGCDRVFAIHELHLTGDAGPDAPGYDRCAPIPDDPLRYMTISNPNFDGVGVAPWSWADARAECMRRGMDLAVPNDEHELSTAQIEIRPYWVGVSSDGTTWSSVDGCPPITPPTSSTGPQCAYVASGATTLAAADCSGTLPMVLPDDPPVVLAALCETPRPSDATCGRETPSYVLSDVEMTYAVAHAHCTARGGHLVVVDSFAELVQLGALASERQLPSVWIGATFDTRTWQSDTTCPGMYAWTDGAPSFGVATSCLATTMRPAVEGGDGALGMTLAGMTPTSCDEVGIHALCELE